MPCEGWGGLAERPAAPGLVGRGLWASVRTEAWAFSLLT